MSGFPLILEIMEIMEFDFFFPEVMEIMEFGGQVMEIMEFSLKMCLICII